MQCKMDIEQCHNIMKNFDEVKHRRTMEHIIMLLLIPVTSSKGNHVLSQISLELSSGRHKLANIIPIIKHLHKLFLKYINRCSVRAGDESNKPKIKKISPPFPYLTKKISPPFL